MNDFLIQIGSILNVIIIWLIETFKKKLTENFYLEVNKNICFTLELLKRSGKLLTLKLK